MRLSGNRVGGGSSSVELTGIYVQVTRGIMGKWSDVGCQRDYEQARGNERGGKGVGEQRH